MFEIQSEIAYQNTKKREMNQIPPGLVDLIAVSLFTYFSFIHLLCLTYVAIGSILAEYAKVVRRSKHLCGVSYLTSWCWRNETNPKERTFQSLNIFLFTQIA